MKYALFLICFLNFSCKPQHKNYAKEGEGTVIYHISYPDSMKYGIKKAFFPSEIVLVFKDEKAAFIATGGMGMIQVVNLLDHKSRSYITLLIDQIHGNYACRLTENEIKQNEGSAIYNYDFTNDSMKIAGISCSRAIATEKEGKPFDIYYDPEIKFYYSNSPFKDFNNLMLNYTHNINGMTMQLKATEVDLKNAVDTNLFNVKGDYKWVNKNQFFDHISTL